MNSAPATRLLRFALIDFALNVSRFPLWWYSRGVQRAWRWYVAGLASFLEWSGLVVVLKNLGRPMYGDFSRSGRVISFFVRLFQIAVLTAVFAAIFVMRTAVFFCYFALLPAVIWFMLWTFGYG